MRKTARFITGLGWIFLTSFVTSQNVWAEDPAVVVAVQEDFSQKPLAELLPMAWAASSSGHYDKVNAITEAALKAYEVEALAEASRLATFPTKDVIEQYKTMNNLATVLFVHAEALMHQGKNEESIAAFKNTIKVYPYAQSWDASRGSFWSVAEKSQESINVMLGVEKIEVVKEAPKTRPTLFSLGTDAIVDYTKYGTFSGIGTKEYKFSMGNPNALARAVGEGIYPNTGDVYKNSRYKDVYREGRLEGSHWDFVNTQDLEAAYFKWAMAPEAPGVKLFFLGLILENSGMYLEAIKAYHALVVNFPNSVSWTYWHTPWYPAQAAIGKIKNILRFNPELKLAFKNAKVDVINGSDKDIQNDIFIVSPGQIVPNGHKKGRPAYLVKNFGKPTRILGGAKARFEQYADGNWRMFVDGKPFVIKGITYSPTKIGQTADKGTIANWMLEDTNGNGRPDGPYDAWVDTDGKKTPVGDFQLLKDMGVNALRVYHHPDLPQKKVLSDLYKKYGIRVIMGDFFGKYTIGSGATWAEGTDYENPVHLANLMKSVEEMVTEFKDEPYVVMWLLGNENNYGVASNADKKPQAYYEFVNKVAKRIKELDPSRPVALCNGDTIQIEYVAKYATEIDVYGANLYRGDYGFGSFWAEVKRVLDRPAFVTEYGAPAYVKGSTLEEAEAVQANYHQGSWLDIMANMAGDEEGEGNAVGGIAFEWLDEWWKNYEPEKHDIKADVIGPFAGGYYYEEWFGIVGQGEGQHSPFLRHLRAAYFMYKKIWNE
ncbi:MAG: hypothetical protein HQL21_01125 [Candidatus Omnitrophica bacterium]|nr:hypothetical protein [Candidatus Omnitrophota bacterium]